MRRIALALHFYQPPMQDLAVTKQVLDSAYLPVLRTIIDHPKAKLTLNISACLLQQLDKLKKNEFFDLVRKAHEQGKIELLAGPAYHPVLPLISDESLERQFAVTQHMYQQYLGILPGRGIFPPELAIDENLFGRLNKFGDYVLIDETSVLKPGEEMSFETDTVIDTGEMRVYVNNRLVCDMLRSFPNRLSGEVFGNWLVREMKPDTSTVIVSDVEVFGHHYQERIEVLKDMFDNSELKFVKLAELADLPAVAKSITPSSWQHVPKDKYQTGPFWLWTNPQNPLQSQYWELAKTVEELFDRYYSATEGLTRDAAAQHLDMGLSSCYPYWISNWPWWHPELVERGAQQLIKCVRTINASREDKMAAEAVYHKFLHDLWKMHWSGQVEENYRQFDLEREKLVNNLPEI